MYFLFSLLDVAWWWFPVLLLLPDVGMIGYLINSRAGAIAYNLFHHRLVAAVVAIIALSFDNQYGELAAIILFAHISIDRIFGFGLKYKKGFQYTHLQSNAKI